MKKNEPIYNNRVIPLNPFLSRALEAEKVQFEYECLKKAMTQIIAIFIFNICVANANKH